MNSDLWIKVCGLTRADDVVAAIDAGADAVGLVLVSRSKRRIDAQRASELAAVARGRVSVVLLVEGDPDRAMADAARVGVDAVQAYGNEASQVAAAAVDAGLGALVAIPVPLSGEIDVSGVPDGARPLLDTAVRGALGGTGVAFEWGRARPIGSAVIAGGLNAGNVATAIAKARPWGVDASSGLEAEVGVKDHGKVAAFVAAARKAAAENPRD